MDPVNAPVPIARLAVRLRRPRTGLRPGAPPATTSRDLSPPLSYDRLLCQAASMLHLPAPAPAVASWDPRPRAHMEAALGRAGLDVGEPAA